MANLRSVFDSRSLAQWQKFFFSGDAVQKAAGRAKAVALRRFGGYVRTTAQRSMRYRKGASQPGTPPSAHKSKRLAALKKLKRAKYNGALLREMIFYAYDPKTGTGVVGPLGFKTRGTPIPALHEFGGTRQGYTGEVIPVKNAVGRDTRTGRFFSRGVQLVPVAGKTLKYPPRPFMRPALDKALPKFAETFKGTVSR